MQTTQRWHGLDLLRSVAMLLGLVIHAAIPFTEPSVNAELPLPAFEAPEAHWLTWSAVLWIHVWRLPVFMILAGFFTDLVIARRGQGAFLKDRTVRIFGTLMVFSVLLTLIGEREWGTFDHLWFLYVLFLFSLMAVTAHAVGLAPRLKPLAWVLGKPARLALLLVPLTLANLIGREGGTWGVIPTDITVEPFSTLLCYAVFFLLGQGLYHDQSWLERAKNPRLWGGLLGAGLVGLTLQGTLVFQEIWEDGPGVLALSLMTAVQSLTWGFGLIGLSLWALRRPSALVNWLVLLAYPVYVLHLDPVIVLTAFFASLGLAQGWAIGAGILSGFAFCAALYLLVLRWTPLDWVLNGYDKARVKWPIAQIAQIAARRKQAGSH